MNVIDPRARRVIPTLLFGLGLTGLAAPGVLQAQEGDNEWSNASELSFVQTGGNAASSTLGLANALTRQWATTELSLEFGGIRTETTRFTRAAVGSAADFRIDERSDSELSTENYYARLRVDRTISDRTALFAQSGWLRNTFAGVDNRYVTVAGLSNQWVDDDRHSFRTGYGVTYTTQDDVVPNPDAADSFVGVQVTSDYRRQVTDNTAWTSRLVIDGNGDDTSDLRADFVNSIGVSMSDHLALKTTLQLLFDNQPSLIEVPLSSVAGDPAGTVFVPLDEFDRVLTVALVVSF